MRVRVNKADEDFKKICICFASNPRRVTSPTTTYAYCFGNFVPQAELSISRANERGAELATLREEVERCHATAQKTEVRRIG